MISVEIDNDNRFLEKHFQLRPRDTVCKVVNDDRDVMTLCTDFHVRVIRLYRYIYSCIVCASNIALYKLH